ncbi:hypothetical protein BM536_000185 [Streptomyces phaeoluteigriseus]|uniref:Major facilitator superfamily (MFS) profile domain-containing protein n=1 Tax=Streptomyces phaeoluteigriseus TaxID=114686 RepID=A0A1V6MZK8_9ACTN|nr:hypothetical protein BM536_000185 [Streptomyces phaeoluteigriseus]
MTCLNHRQSRGPAALFGGGCAGVFDTQLNPRVATLAVLATSAGQATLAVYAAQTAPAAQRPTAIGLFNLCYQLGGAFGPAIAALITLGG